MTERSVRSRALVFVGALALAVSVTLNVALLLRNQKLEERLWLTCFRFSGFVGITSHIVARAQVSRKQLENSGVLGGPVEEGPSFFIDRDPHFGDGIRYEFGSNGMLSGWKEEPPIGIAKVGADGGKVLRTPHELAKYNDGLRIPR
jgi:hypothetical protein